MLKLLLLKISVGAIVVLGLVESFLYSSGTSPFKDDDEFNAEEKTLRAYCEWQSLTPVAVVSSLVFNCAVNLCVYL